MNSTTLIIIWLTVGTCSAQIIRKTSKFNNVERLAELTVEILSSCYKKQVNTVGLAGTSYDPLFAMLPSKLSLPIALIGNETDNEPVDRKSRHKLQLFIVSASSSKHLEQILKQIKRSHWWNHMATYLILDWHHSSMEDRCSDAYPFMWTAWKMDLLKSFYVCIHPTRGQLIYSYNPYTSKAPDSWQLENTYKGKNDHPWSLFRRENVNGQICKDLEYDNTNDLGGYEIVSTIKHFSPFFLLNLNATNKQNRFGGYLGHFSTALLHAMKSNALFVFHDDQSPGLYDKIGRDIAMDTVDHISDIVLIPRLYVAVRNFTLSYPFGEAGLRIMTQRTGDMSQLDKLLQVLDKSSRYSICLVVLMTVIFFKFCLRQPMGTAILNVFRIVANSSLTKEPKNQGARIYLAGVFILVVTIVGIYQGMLSSLLTKPKALPNVETVQDLIDRGYTIHSNKLYAGIFENPILNGRYVKHDKYNCTKYVLRDTSAACVAALPRIIKDLHDFKLHLSSEMLAKTWYVFVIRDDWPLEERLNVVTAALIEADMEQQIFNKEFDKILSVERYNENLKENTKFIVIVLNDLSFAFVLLAIGLSCATVCFVVEVAISKPR